MAMAKGNTMATTNGNAMATMVDMSSPPMAVDNTMTIMLNASSTTMVVDDPIAMTLDASSIAIGRRPNSHDAGCEFYNDGGQ